jgi:twitching motility protein PilT
VNLLRQLGQRAAVLRRIRSEIPDMETLGVPAGLLCDWIRRRAGMVLVCGPTGSGKSTTLAAALEWLNENSSRHVITIEDPIEYLFSSRMSLFPSARSASTPELAEDAPFPASKS